MFVPGKLFQPSQCLWVRPGAYPSVEQGIVLNYWQCKFEKDMKITIVIAWLNYLSILCSPLRLGLAHNCMQT
jgi:hypothetical protein